MAKTKLRRRSTLTLIPTGEGSLASLDRSPTLSSQSRRQQKRDHDSVVLTQEILMDALEDVKPSVTEKERAKYSKLYVQKRETGLASHNITWSFYSRI